MARGGGRSPGGREQAGQDAGHRVVEQGLLLLGGVAVAAQEWIEREVDSGPRDTRAQSRQVGAQWHGPKLRELRKPVLVLHGDHDPILRVSAARATAKAIDGARLVVLPGVGHDLPAPLWPAIAKEVRQLADRARASSR
jgi:pimeloyl-ACP methyl ester carboxylesterase